MRYSDYFIEQLNDNHPEVKLSKKTVHTMLLVQDFEYRIASAAPNDFETRYKFQKKLNELTMRLTPEKFYKKLLLY